MVKHMGKESAKRIGKKIRGENEPKKPPTEYFMFLRDERKKLEKGMPVKEQTQILSKLWAELDPERRKRYAEEYVREVAAYKKKMEEYKKTDEYKQVSEKNVELKKGRAKTKTKRKPSGYNLFVKEQRAKMAVGKKEGGKAPSFKEISQIISGKWHSLTDAERHAYKTEASSLPAEHASKESTDDEDRGETNENSQ